jgi:hypothetical protein
MYILDLRLLDHLRTEVTAEFRGGPQIDLSAQSGSQFFLHPHHREIADLGIRVELNENIYVAIRMKVVPQNGAKQAQSRNVESLAKVC